jgi:chorismate dehydratase
MWNFEHSPEQERLALRYVIEKMTPARCAARLGAGEADLGLIPIAAYAGLGGLAIVPGCTIASLGGIRSILLVLRGAVGRSVGNEPDLLTAEVRAAVGRVRSVALDTASRTSAMYTRILFRKYWRVDPVFVDHAAELDAMLKSADAALLIGDPALYALEDRAAREARSGERLVYLDLGDAWQREAGVPWVSAFWAAREAAMVDGGPRVCADLLASRDAGMGMVGVLAEEWSGRLGLPVATVETYLSRNIHYILDERCLGGIKRFYEDAAECGLLERRPELRFLSA